jgi:hypothetical protein
MIRKEIQTPDGPIMIRGLKHGEIKRLRAEGIDLSQQLEGEALERATERVVGLVLDVTPEQVDELIAGTLLMAFGETVNLTYLREESAKN